MGANKITSAQRAALQWFAERDPVAAFDRHAPSRVTRNRLRDAGLIEAVGTGAFGFVAFTISAAGREALTTSGGN